jgi:hypothetical protein
MMSEAAVPQPQLRWLRQLYLSLYREIHCSTAAKLVIAVVHVSAANL